MLFGSRIAAVSDTCYCRNLFARLPMKILFLCLLALVAGASTLFAQNPANPVVRFHTDLGDIDVTLLEDVAPNTVANFLRYVNRGAYDNTFIHRSVPNFVIQGGGYRYVNNQVLSVPKDSPVANEFRVSNTRGTLAMAKLGGNPNSATNEWFFNEVDSNATNLDSQNGGFTVFGRILDAAGLSVMDSIRGVPIFNAGSPFDQLPLRNFTSGPIQDANLVHVISVKVISVSLTISHPAENVFRLQGQGAPNTAYRLESSRVPAASDFTLLATLTSDSSGNFSYDDTDSGATKFYRLLNP